MEAGLHVVLALITGVDESVLALVVQLHEHAHGAPLGPPQGAELQMLVARQRQKGIAAIHQVARHQRIRVHYGGQGVRHGAGNQADHKEHLRCGEGGQTERDKRSDPVKTFCWQSKRSLKETQKGAQEQFFLRTESTFYQLFAHNIDNHFIEKNTSLCFSIVA